MTKRSLQARFHYGFNISILTKPLPITRWNILQQARSKTLSRSSSVCKLAISRSFHSPSGVLFTFPSRYLFTIGCLGIFSLTRWSSQIHTRFHVSHATWEKIEKILAFNYKTITFFGSSFQYFHLAIIFFFLFNPTTLLK